MPACLQKRVTAGLKNIQKFILYIHYSTLDYINELCKYLCKYRKERYIKKAHVKDEAGLPTGTIRGPKVTSSLCVTCFLVI